MNIEKTIQVRITDVSESSYWYSEQIGKEYDVYVIDSLIKDYAIKEDYDKCNAEAFRMIRKEDCEVILDKELESKIRANFTEALNRFDFAKVQNVMTYLDWTWCGEKYSPSQGQMINMVQNELFKWAIKDFNNKQTNVGSGGFLVTIFEDGKVQIQFVVEESYSYD